MNIPVVREVIPFLIASLAIFGLPGLIFNRRGKRKIAFFCYMLAIIAAFYMLYFFRDPFRVPPNDPGAVLAGADGVVMSVVEMREDDFLNTDSVRISIFLSLFDVHINRAPIAGTVTKLGYYPGKRFFTFKEEASEFNQHSVILIEGERTTCLVKQIVGPVARRVVYWLNVDQQLDAGERIGMMKFGSRLDMYFPKDDVKILVSEGDRVQAGLTIVGRLADN